MRIQYATAIGAQDLDYNDSSAIRSMNPTDSTFIKAVEKYIAEKGGHDFYANRVDPYASTIETDGTVILRRKKTLEVLAKYSDTGVASEQEKEANGESSFQKILLEEREHEPIYAITCRDKRYTFAAYDQCLQIIDHKKNQTCEIGWRDVKEIKPFWTNPRQISMVIPLNYPLWARSVVVHAGGVTQCNIAINELDRSRRRIAAEQAIAEQRELASIDQYYSATIVGVINLDLPEGVAAEVVIGLNTIEIRVCDVSHCASIDIKEVVKIDISGPGTVTTNAGLVGGGFGFEGAVWGIAAASVINALTTTSTTNTFLTIATRRSSLTIHTSQYDTEALRMRLSSIIAAAESRANLPAESTNADIPGKIKQLGELKAQGLLSEEEFTIAKMKILGL